MSIFAALWGIANNVWSYGWGQGMWWIDDTGSIY